MAYNLIEERWIPVRRKSGKVERIAPWQIADEADPPVTIESSRPDFDAALLEMLIGLVQTVMTPKDESEWADRYESGITEKDLHKRMKSVGHAFDLDGDGPRFFQDLTVAKDPKASREPIAALLIDQGTADDTDLFAKGGRFEELSLPMAAAALLTLQSFAPPGGRGNMTSLRGGGPLSITLCDATLWKTVWCNVLNAGDLAEVPGNRKRTNLDHTFPWLAPTRTSEGKDGATTTEHIHPLQHFWGLPRRIRLAFDGVQKGRCAITGDTDVPVVREYLSRPNGTSYEGPFLHPLTAYTVTKESEPPNPKKGSSGFGYRDWPLVNLGGEKLIPPRVVAAFYRNQRWRVAPVSRLAARGYVMDNMKPLRFLEAETPVLHVEPQLQEVLRTEAQQLVEASESVRRTLAQQVKAGWSDRPKDQSGDVDARCNAAFWAATEASFYRTLTSVAAELARGAEGDPARVAAKTAFLGSLQLEALAIFDVLCPTEADLGAGDLSRVVTARKNLRFFARPEALAPLVGLAEPEAPKKKSSRKKSDDPSPKAGRKGRAS